MKGLIYRCHASDFFGAIFHTLIYCLKKELKGYSRVLDLGCGPFSPLSYCKNISYSVGVDAFASYLERSRGQGIHTQYIHKKVEEVDFSENSFDAVILIDVLEHLPEASARDILKKAEKWAKEKIIVSSPNGFIPQKEVDNNSFQRHLSGWDYLTMRKLGFTVHGLAGLKFLRQEVQNDTMGDDLMNSIRFFPKPFWFAVAALSQTVFYFFPALSYGLFSVKKLDKK